MTPSELAREVVWFAASKATENHADTLTLLSALALAFTALSREAGADKKRTIEAAQAAWDITSGRRA